MERKTIGGFMAALRKANGLTQKDLAEKLNVSDKSVSRWERDDGAPDLSLIPVIAEIFGVTSDELLRGERKSAGEQPEDKPHPKTEKQRQRILAAGLSKYKNRSVIAAGLAVLGLIIAMVVNFGFNRALIGFFCGSALYLASVIFQVVCLNNAMLTVADDEMAGPEVERFKRSVILTAEKVVSLCVVLLCISLPLGLLVTDAYVGLTAASWFPQGALTGLIGLVLCALVCYFLTNSLQKRGVYSLTEKEAAAYQHNFKLKRRCALTLFGLLLVTFAGHAIATGGWDAPSVAKGTVFEDYDSFISYMEQDVPAMNVWGARATPQRVAGDEGGQYYDAAGNEITEEEALRRTLTDSEGNVVCEYIERNQSVWSIRYGIRDGSLLPITTYSQNDIRQGQARINMFNAIFTALYLLELAAMLVIYFRKRVRQ